MDRHPTKFNIGRAVTVKEFSKICRFCMSHSEILKAIFKDETYSTKRNITKITECLHLDIDPNAELPLFICPECIEKLVNCFNFWKQCVNSHNRLTEILKKEQNESDPPPLQDDDDVHMDVEKVFCLESTVKVENSEDEDEKVLLDVSEISATMEPDSGNRDEFTPFESSNNSKDSVEERNGKNKVGRPKKPIKTKL